MIRVAIVDDQEMVRLGLPAILERIDDIDVVTEAADGLAGIAAVRSLEPHVVLMDIRMPGIDGVEATRRSRQFADASAVKILVLTTFERDSTVLEALRAGANGFLSKGVGPTELISSVREIAAGGSALSSGAASSLIGHLVERPQRDADPELADRFSSLTTKEREVVISAAAGKSNAEIAAEFNVSPFKVKTHATRAMTKVGARDRAQLIAFAYRAGIVD